MRKGFSLVEMVFVIVILGVLAGVAVPKFVATRIDKKVATLRSDTANTLKVIVAKVFADNLDTTNSLAPHPDDRTKTPKIYWSEWMIEVAGLNRTRWLPSLALNNQERQGISPAYKVGKYNIPCGSKPYIQIMSSGDLYFDPSALAIDGSHAGMGVQSDYEVCLRLKESYRHSNGFGNKLIPLTATNTINF